MNCQEFWEQEPAPLEHINECRSCAVRYARERRLSAGLRTLGADLRHLRAPVRVERRLLTAFRAQKTIAAPRSASWVPAAAWASALAATVLAGFVLLGGRQPQRAHHVVRNPIELAVAESPEAAEPVAGAVEGYEDFIPLPNAEGIAPNEQVNLVRVEVPRSAMIPLGFAVSEESASETVEADVVLGADGLARAVRFLGEFGN
jgi:hypothetical protein